jgi:UDP-N-acetylmuramate dehydrogenase
MPNQNPAFLKLKAKFPLLEELRPLAPLTSFGVGGPADLFYELADTTGFEPLMKAAAELGIPTFVLGGGSNTIFADEGFRGLVILMAAKNISLESDGVTIAADAGVRLSQVIQFALKNKLTGTEKLMGIPGTVGGAVRGNAGAFGLEIGNLVQKALIYDPKIGLFEGDKQYLNFGYRTSTLKTTGQIALKIWIKLFEADAATLKAAVAEAMDIVKNRIGRQPKGRCSGSFFKNPVAPDYSKTQPPETRAGYLLEQIGAKGLRVGGAMVSEQHANWLMNTGNATQKDVIELCNTLKSRVKERFQVELETEVQLVSATGQLIY